MTPDVRDQSVAAWLDSAIGGLEPDPDRRLPDVRRKGRARRTARWTAIVASLASIFVWFSAMAACWPCTSLASATTCCCSRSDSFDGSAAGAQTAAPTTQQTIRPDKIFMGSKSIRVL